MTYSSKKSGLFRGFFSGFKERKQRRLNKERAEAMQTIIAEGKRLDKIMIDSKKRNEASAKRRLSRKGTK